MNGKDDDVPVLEHDHDGIQEYDNPLPAWWLWTFLLTVIFGFHYWLHYEIAGGPTLKDELAEDRAALQLLKKSQPASGDNEEELSKLAGEAAFVGAGKEVFAAKCAVCHGQDLQGSIGPNLTDEYWLHGKGSLREISAVVRAGVLDKGMPSWETMLKTEELNAVVVYVGSKKGSSPANPKAPQGDKVAN